ncbi:unnamed protein product [Prorocentrum cordatum]|uniref:Anaphase-promoting complex subunit 11 n=1 Tax=Prorocentrum cordatum TaxID=2364126 RepID=A0ABN9U8B5_9DINO|nr:unnamed protein product [Polarella glacialis]
MPARGARPRDRAATGPAPGRLHRDGVDTEMLSPLVESRAPKLASLPLLGRSCVSAGRGRGGGRGRKRARADGGEETPPASAAAGLAAGGDGGQEAETPEALQAPAARRRWGAGLLRPGAADKPAEPLAEAALGAPKTAWGSRLRRPTRVIALDAGLESDSDADGVVLLGLQGHLAAGFGSASSSSSSAAAPRAGPGAARTAPGPRGSELPPRPDSSDDEEMGDQRGIDLSSSPLMSTRWGRVVLDEAHRIKGRINSTAQAAFALKASTRWCLSGTPLQNRVGELYSLARFVRFYPYAHYFCVKKGCDCASLHYRFDPTTSTCCKCGHAKAQHRSHFASEGHGCGSTPIKRFGFMGAGRTAMEKLRADVLDKILLRRTKEERQADIRLPPLKISIRKDSLSAEERDFYTSMYMQSQTKFDTYVEKDTLLHNYAHVFDLIMRLRQALDHPYLIVHGSLRQENGLIPSKSRGDAHVCALCQEDVSERSELVVASCGHAFHRECVSEYLEQAPTLPTGGIGCPTCFAPLTLSLEEADDDDAAGLGGEMGLPPDEATLAKKPPSRSILQRIKTAEFKTSTKIEALLQEVQQMMQNNGSSKALVFSQFVNFLELIEWRLKREGIQCAKLLGSMPITNRNNIILSFMSDPHLKVLLISLKAGGEGLNLQAADHIFLMDPWWNPASELQAIQRAHRIGQTRPVKAVRFVMTDTIEEKIIELQNKKQSVFDCTVGGSNTALQRLTSEDIKFLFNQ